MPGYGANWRGGSILNPVHRALAEKDAGHFAQSRKYPECSSHQIKCVSPILLDLEKEHSLFVGLLSKAGGQGDRIKDGGQQEKECGL